MSRRRSSSWSLARVFAFALVSAAAHADPVISQAVGANAAGIQASVDSFRAALGAQNPNQPVSFPGGRREINWDGVPDSSSSPSFLPNNFFNATSPRGVVMNTLGEASGAQNRLLVSADTDNPNNSAVRFGDIDPSYTAQFVTFSSQRLFVPRASRQTEVLFFVPGSGTPATVSAFGVIFADVDLASTTIIRMFALDGTQIAATAAPVANGGLSFVGVTFDAGERIARVVLEIGNRPLAAGAVDGVSGVDVVAMDDFIYAEPRSILDLFENGFEP